MNWTHKIIFCLAIIGVSLIIIFLAGSSCATTPKAKPDSRCTQWTREVRHLEVRIEIEPNEEWRARLIENREDKLTLMREAGCPDA